MTNPELKRELKNRQITMISLGGIIGAALFVGASGIINQAGPLAFVAYALSGLLVLCVMRMLGEMAVARPSSGSFVDYARMALGGWAGFTTGWMYWYFWVIVVGFEAVVSGQIINRWFPALPVWLVALTLLVVMTGVNLLSVKNFGEAEYWFASIKVFALVAFIGVGVCYVLGVWPDKAADFSNLTDNGGLFPNGTGALLVGVALVITSMTGAEIVTIAAAESLDPARAVKRAVNSVVFRVVAFFVGSTFLIVLIVPWQEIVPGESPFVAALNVMGLPGAARLLDVVILVTVLSVLNTGLYTSSRVLLSLSTNGDAPRSISRVSSRGVPARGVLACTFVGYGCVILAAAWPDGVFLFLLNSAGAVVLFIYFVICVSEIVLRKRWRREGADVSDFKMWFWPYLPVVVAGAILAVLLGMGIRDATRVEFLQSVAVWVVLCTVYAVRKTFGSRNRNQQQEASDEYGDFSGADAVVDTSDPQ